MSTTRPNPTMEIGKLTINGKTAIELVVRNAHMGTFQAPSEIGEKLEAELDRLGILPTPGISNRRSLICTSPVELDAARAPLAKYFGATGEWIG